MGQRFDSLINVNQTEIAFIFTAISLASAFIHASDLIVNPKYDLFSINLISFFHQLRNRVHNLNSK